MRNPGKTTEKLDFFNKIDETEFVDLVADILFVCFGHTEIKITDGPGDGTRDIFSVNEFGRNCITQCKYHNDYTKTASSQETGQLLLGLHKFHYKDGYFMTNAKISPQAKRESKDNYKGFNIEFKDGGELCDYLKTDPVLTSVWIEGLSITNGITSISIPVVVRDYITGNSIQNIVIEESKHSIGDNINVVINNRNNKMSRFEPYELPSNRIQSDGWSSSISTLNFNFIGEVKLHMIDQYIEWINDYLSQILESQRICHIACVRFGVPSLEQSTKKVFGKLTELRVFEPFSILHDSVKGKIIDEKKWQTEISEDWSVPQRIHMSQLRYYCLYNSEIDTSMMIEYIGGICREDRLKFDERETFRKIMWDNSLFIMGTGSELLKIEEELKIEKTMEFEVFGGTKVYCWEHPSEGFRPVINESLENYIPKVLDEDFIEFRNNAKDIVPKYEVQLLMGETALHFARASGFDPIFSSNECVYDTVDFLDHFQCIPSPIIPQNKKFIYETVYVFNYVYTNRMEIEKYLEEFNSEMSKVNLNGDIELIVDEDYTNGFYLKIVQTLNTKPILSTEENLVEHKNVIQKNIEHYNQIVSAHYSDCGQMTKDYWFYEYGVML